MDNYENNPDNIDPLTFEGYTTLKAYIKALQKIEDETPNTIFYLYQDYDSLVRRFITIDERIIELEERIKANKEATTYWDEILEEEGDPIYMRLKSEQTGHLNTIPRKEAEEYKQKTINDLQNIQKEIEKLIEIKRKAEQDRNIEKLNSIKEQIETLNYYSTIDEVEDLHKEKERLEKIIENQKKDQ